MKPKNIFFFVLIIISILTIISFLFPKNGIYLSDSIVLKFISFNDFVTPQIIEYADISHLANVKAIKRTSDTIYIEKVVYDSALQKDIVKMVVDTIRANSDSLKNSVFQLQFKDNANSLNEFFTKLRQLEIYKNRTVRIMHFGDSQIEADRISCTFRNYLQKNFGGNGLGLFPAYEENKYAVPLILKYTGNWQRYTKYGIPDSTINHNNYGMLASFSRFTHIINDTIPINENVSEASVSFKPRERWVYKSRSKFNTIKIFAGNNTKPCFTEIYVKDSLVYMSAIDTNKQINTISWKNDKYISEATIKFISQDSPDIYGISLEDTVGVIVDNIPMRGSSGTLFTRINKKHLKQSFDLIQPNLFILEFGLNVVPNLVESYKYYENRIYKQIMLLKELCPDVGIIVIGISDMSQKSGNYYETYPNVEKIRDAQKNAAFRADCAFWDMYEAMGGRNSMPSWVFANPPLAQKDFTHLNYEGSKIIGNMFYNAFKHEYLNFVKREANN